MADEPENLTLTLLREIRGEMREGFEKAFGELAELRIGVAALSVDLKATKETVEQILKTQQNHGARLNAIDGRLAIIEERTGLVKA